MKQKGRLNRTYKCIGYDAAINGKRYPVSDFRFPTKPSNADRIRAMSDEELAEWLDGGFRHADWCDISKFPNGDCMEVPCLGCIIDWLKQEDEDDA